MEKEASTENAANRFSWFWELKLAGLPVGMELPVELSQAGTDRLAQTCWHKFRLAPSQASTDSSWHRFRMAVSGWHRFRLAHSGWLAQTRLGWQT